jgi:hypothetical protein
LRILRKDLAGLDASHRLQGAELLEGRRHQVTLRVLDLTKRPACEVAANERGTRTRVPPMNASALLARWRSLQGRLTAMLVPLLSPSGSWLSTDL